MSGRAAKVNGGNLVTAEPVAMNWAQTSTTVAPTPLVDVLS
jgi:hypothetical protein